MMDSSNEAQQSTLNKPNEQLQQKIKITKVIYKNITSPTKESVVASPMIGHRPRSGSAREQALHAVEYYNSNVLRARLGAGLARNSVNERILNNRSQPVTTRYLNSSEHLYRSNSSLELISDPNSISNNRTDINNGVQNGTLGRQYGSHGSIDVISTPPPTGTSDSFFTMLQEYRPAVLSVVNSNESSEFIESKKFNMSDNRVSKTQEIDHHLSPKLKNKLHRLWGQHNIGQSKSNKQEYLPITEDASFISNSSTSSKQSFMNHSSLPTHSAASFSADIEERQRRRSFAHYDCQSLTANLGYAAKIRGLLLARRRNTTTGASAASMMNARSTTPDLDSGDEDFGDGQYNELVENCPYFRNEIGGEEEREVSLTRMHSSNNNKRKNRITAIHRPALAYGVSILECLQGESLWRQNTCPFQKVTKPIESIDLGARYYRNYFAGQEHQNWFGMDDQLGPIAVSIKREKLPEHPESTSSAHNQFRLIIRTSELLTLRGLIIEDAIPNSRGSFGKAVNTKEILEYVAPEIQLNTLRLGVNTPQCEQQLIKLDEQGLTNKYKVGILYCRAEQSSEEDMYNNEEAGPAFIEFLETIGQRVKLKGFENYKAGLDNKTDSTGTHSLYATYQDCEIMFHVSTMLPFTPNNRQQLLRKRHIGNDIVTIVFQEPGALPFSPKNIRSQFQHVFIIVRAVNPFTENTMYRVAVARSKEVPVFGPPVPATIFGKNRQLSDFLLAKIINAENAAHRSEKFATMATRTRQEYLKDLATNYCTTTLVEQISKFSIFPNKKREKPKLRFSGDAIQRGAFCWQVVLQDSGLSLAVDCFLGISTETFVLIEECSRQIVFVTPTKTILGWSASGNSLKIYHHQGECITINMRETGERDEQLEVIERLRAVSSGCGALELSLRRNPMGQLGFHVQPDGVVTQVETSGQAWVAGLRQGCRLVEICKIAVATLSHDQMVDLLKTSAQVQVTVIESFPDFSPRRGCYLPNCKFNIFNFDGNDYETTLATNNGDSPSKNLIKKHSSAQLQQQSTSNHRRRYERNFSPPRSSNSSGYGTGSSLRSFSIPNEHARQTGAIDNNMGTLTSSSSGHSSNDDRWYDVLQNVPENSSINQQKIASDKHKNLSHHQKLNATSSLPLNTHMRPLSLHDPTKMSAITEHNRPSPRMANVEYLITKPPQQVNANYFKDTTTKELKSLTHSNDAISSDLSETNFIDPVFKSVVDDGEILGISPRLRRSATTTNIIMKSRSTGNGSVMSSSSTSSSSRNNSPRPQNEMLNIIGNGTNSNATVAAAAAKLRPGVTNNNHNSRNIMHLNQRNSVNYTNNSSLQEDLMKLINPDYLSNDDSCINNNSIKNSIFHQTTSSSKISITNSHSLGNISQLSGSNLSTMHAEEFAIKNKSRSREGINLGNQLLPDLKSDDEKTEDIYTTAEPATVISQVENILHISEGNTPNFWKTSNIKKNKKENQFQPPLPLMADANDMDWSTLVDTATRAALVLQFQDEQIKLEKSHSENSIAVPPPSSSTSSSSEGHYSQINENGSAIDQIVGPLPEIQNHLLQLEDRILKETRRRKSLEHTVKKLTEENRRLQDESQAAVQQLRRFTEWFFQTIDKQS